MYSSLPEGEATDGRYWFVGPCYVDDVMEGEVAKAWEAREAHFGPFWSGEYQEASKKWLDCAATSRLAVIPLDME